MCAGKNARYTFNWQDVPGGMEDPVVCPTVATTKGTASDTEDERDDEEAKEQSPVEKEKEVIILSWANRTDMRLIIFGLGHPFAFCSRFGKAKPLAENSTMMDRHHELSPTTSPNESSAGEGSLDND
jgi:hypothetical protein